MVEKYFMNIYKKFLKKQDGQLLIEILVAIGVGSILITGATIAITATIRSNFETRGLQEASLLARDQMDKVRSFASQNWYNIDGLSKGSSSRYMLIPSATNAVAILGEESIVAKDVGAGLVGYWKFDEETASTTYDFSGNGKNATLYAGVSRVASTSCQTGKCLQFDGSSGYTKAESVDISSTDKISIAFWIKFTGTTVKIPLEHSVNFNSNNAFYIGHSSRGVVGSLQFSDHNSGYNMVYTNQAYNDGNWHYVVMISDRSLGINQSSIYVDGTEDTVLDATYRTDLSGNYGNFDLYIGSRAGSSYFLNGSLDDVRIYSRALSEYEVRRLYEGTVYNRYFYVETVNRDACGVGNVTSSVATSCTTLPQSGVAPDGSTYKITHHTQWESDHFIEDVQYVTRTSNDVVFQTDWVRGSGQEGSITQSSAMFATSSNVDFISSLTLTSPASSGWLISSTFDTQQASGTALNSVIWQGTQPSNTVVKIQIGASTSSSPTWQYLGPDGTASTYYTVSPNTPAIINAKNYTDSRYIRYKVYLEPSGGTGPTVDSLSINWSR